MLIFISLAVPIYFTSLAHIFGYQYSTQLRPPPLSWLVVWRDFGCFLDMFATCQRTSRRQADESLCGCADNKRRTSQMTRNNNQLIHSQARWGVANVVYFDTRQSVKSLVIVKTSIDRLVISRRRLFILSRTGPFPCWSTRTPLLLITIRSFSFFLFLCFSFSCEIHLPDCCLQHYGVKQWRTPGSAHHIDLVDTFAGFLALRSVEEWKTPTPQERPTLPSGTIQFQYTVEFICTSRINTYGYHLMFFLNANPGKIN